MVSDYSQLLSALNLNKKEIDAYTSIVELGRPGISQIAKHSGIPRTTMYFVMRRLLETGIIKKELVPDGGSCYVACDPKAFHRLLEKDKESLVEKEKAIEDLCAIVAPLLQQQPNIPKLQFVEGRDEVENMLYEALPKWRATYAKLDDFTIWGYQDDNFVKEYRRWLEHAWSTRCEREVTCLFTTRQGLELQRKDNISQRIVKLLPKGYEFPCSILIHGDHIVFARTRDKVFYAVMLIDEVIAKAQRTMFEIIWSLAPDE